MKGRITEITGSRYPILLGPMRFISLGRMAALVSLHGGFGQIAASGLAPDRLREEIRIARGLTDAPVGLNIPVYRPNAFDALEIAIEEGIRTVTTSAGDPRKLIGRIREAGLRVLHKCGTVSMDLKAQEAGVDGVIVSGCEAGGHVGREEITTLALLPQMADALTIPVVAAGGIGDGRGVLAAMALGAEGVEMGTRFLATAESPISDAYKQLILRAPSDGTIVVAKSAMPCRVLRNAASGRLLRMELEGAPKEEINAYTDEYYCHPDSDLAFMPAGQVSGMITEITTIRDVLEKTMLEVRSHLTRLTGIAGGGEA